MRFFLQILILLKMGWCKIFEKNCFWMFTFNITSQLQPNIRVRRSHVQSNIWDKCLLYYQPCKSIQTIPFQYFPPVFFALWKLLLHNWTVYAQFVENLVFKQKLIMFLLNILLLKIPNPGYWLQLAPWSTYKYKRDSRAICYGQR